MANEPGQIAFEAYWAEHKDHMPWDSDDLNNPRWARVEAACFAAALEEAAKVAERFGSKPAPASDGMGTSILQSVDGYEVASAIRALIPTRPAGGGEAG